MNKDKTVHPFLWFAVTSFFCGISLGGFTLIFCSSFSLDQVYQRISLTQSISIFGTFIPLVFAAMTYCKSKLTETAPEIFSELSIDKKNHLAWAILICIFILSLMTPFMVMEDHYFAILQLLLIFCSFLVSGTFIWEMFNVAKYSNVLPLFGQAARKELDGILSKFSSIGVEVAESRVKCILENLIAMSNVHIKRGSREDLKITLQELQLYMYSFFELIDKNIIKNDPTVYLSLEETSSITHKNHLLQELHKTTTNLFFLEFCKLIHGVSNTRDEKFLENFIPTLEALIPKSLMIDTTYHVQQWDNFISETVARTAVLKHTHYPIAAIDLYEKFADIVFVNNSDYAVYEFCSRYETLLLIISHHKSKEKDYKMWYSVLQGRVISIMLSILPRYVKYGGDRYVLKHWAESLARIVSANSPKEVNILSDGNPISIITEGLSQPSLPTIYQEAVEIVISSEFDNRVKFQELYALLPVYQVYHTLIKEDNDPNTKLLNCLVRHFHIDSSFCVKVPQLSDYWIKEVSGQYAKIFDDLQKRYIAMQGQIGPSETQAMMDIPAIALVAKHESQIKFSDIVVDSYADLLINEFNGIDPDHTNGIERANILLLSSWLKKTGRLEKTRKRLESILKKHPYSSPSVHMSPYYASGYPRFDTSMWYIPSYDNTFELIRVELMDEEFLLNYAKQFVS